MSLDLKLYVNAKIGHREIEDWEVYHCNITHNLTYMAKALGIYGAVWRPEENDIKSASELAAILEPAVKELEDNMSKYQEYDSPNGWGLARHFLPFLKNLMQKCREWPEARVEACR